MAKQLAILAAALSLATMTAEAQESAEPPAMASETTAEFAIPEANQGVGVDDKFFYAVDNHTIAKYDKATGQKVQVWDGGKDGPIKHLDSAVVVDGKIYTAHSNYPEWPMTSSVEVFDAATLEHVDTHSFGIDRGSFTWLDFQAADAGGAASPTTTACSTAAPSPTATSTTRRWCASPPTGRWPRPGSCPTSCWRNSRT